MMGNLKWGKLFVLVSTLTLGLGVKVAAEPWNKPIPEPTSESTPQTIKLADELTKAGAKMFGAHWCPACKEQLRLFGKQAGRELDYVECGMPDKYPLQVQQCSEAKIKTIPTWTKPGSKNLLGVQSISNLESWSKL